MFVFDFHQDIAWKRLNHKEKFFQINPLWENKNSNIPNQSDLPRLKKGGVKLVFGSSFSEKADVKEIERQIKFYLSLVNNNKEFCLIRSKRDLEDLMKSQKIGILLHIEGLDFIKSEDDLKIIDYFSKIGVRSLGMTHNKKNYLAGGALEEGGLTELGKKLIEKCQKLNIIIDMAHLNRVSFSEVLEILQSPPLFSHGNIDKLFIHPRNLNDKQIKEIIQKKGLIGISFVPRFLKTADLHETYRNFQYLIELGGSENLAIGSDFDGMLGRELVQGLEDVSKFKNLEDVFRKNNLSEENIDKIFYKNALRFLKQAL